MTQMTHGTSVVRENHSKSRRTERALRHCFVPREEETHQLVPSQPLPTSRALGAADPPLCCRWTAIIMKLSAVLLLAGGLIAGSSGFQAPLGYGYRSTAASRHHLSLSSPLYAYVDFDEDTPRDIETFDGWATECGVQKASGFQLTTEDGLDWSVMTNEDLPAESPVVFVPNNMMLSSFGAREEFGQLQEAEELIGRLGGADQFPLFYIFVKILWEFQQGDESPWFPWLNSLPRSFNNGASMTPVCYECLPPLVSKLAMEERVRHINFNQALKTVEFISDEVKSNMDLTKWAFNVASTRNFEVEGERVIVPMADMFNHGTYPNIQITYDEEGNCVVYTTCDVPAGEPLKMSYGDPTNPSYLFATYGFLDETSPATFCKIMNIQPNSELRDIGLDFSRMLFYKDSGEVSEEVWDVLLYQVLNNNRKVQKAFYDAHMAGDTATKSAYHQQYLFETSSALKKHIDTFLTELGKLSDNARSKDFKEHPRIPLILSHNDFVRTTFLSVKEKIDPIVKSASRQTY